MSIWTLAELNELIDGMKEQLRADPLGSLGSVTIGSRTVAYRSVQDMKELILFYAREKATLERRAAGGRRNSYAVAKFQ